MNVPTTTRAVLSVGVLAVSGVLLFARLGTAPMWCDEADTALFAQGVLRTGDMTAQLGDNLYALRGGCMLADLKNRCTPPLPMYVAAAGFAAGGETSWAGRLPFALFAALCVALGVFWLWQSAARTSSWWLLSLGILGQVSFFLFARQCRYYALATLLTWAAVYVYLHGRGSRRALVAISLLGALLAATHYLSYAALAVALAVDYIVWRRREPGPNWSRSEIALALAAQAAFAIALVSVYNPLGRMGQPQTAAGQAWIERLTLLWWNLRDSNACEFGVGWLLLAAPIVGWLTRDRWLGRVFVAWVTYVVVVTLLSPQAVAVTEYADVRYLCAALPLCLLLTVRVLQAITLGRRWLLALLAPLALVTNVLHWPLSPGRWRSTPVQFAQELMSPDKLATQRTIEWLRAHVRPCATVWVVPLENGYPLMFHLPELTYGWQLDPPASGQFAGLPPVQFMMQREVDYVIAFGHRANELARREVFARWPGRYERAATLDVFFDDGLRPELFWHPFVPPRDFDPAVDGVFIYRRRATPPG